jgi:ABC-type lipoprotein export system ATPase subunit
METITQPSPLLRAENLTKRYGRHTVLKGVSLSVAPGETVAVTGVSGAGKTTLLSVLGTLERADSGAVFFDGVRLGPRNSRLFRSRDVGFVFQDSCLIEELTAAENVRCAMRLAGRTGDPKTFLAPVGLAELADRYPNTLSGGEARRVSVARALSKQPRLLLLDEPTQGLDPDAAERFMTLLLSLAEERGISVVLVTHDRACAGRLSRRLRLVDGQLIEEA